MVKACWNRVSREGEGASCGDTVTKGTPKPHRPPLLSASQSTESGSGASLALPPGSSMSI